MKQTIASLMLAVLVSMTACGSGNDAAPASGPVDATVAATTTPPTQPPMTTAAITAAPTEALFSNSIAEVDALLQGSWYNYQGGNLALFTFEDGYCTLESLITGITIGIWNCEYTIEDSYLLLLADGESVPLDYTLSGGNLSLSFPDGGRGALCQGIKPVWKMNYYLDKFNQDTGKRYIIGDFSGVFSNSATDDSSLRVEMYVDAENISICLYEYDQLLVKNGSAHFEDVYDISMQKADSTTIEMTGTMLCGGDRIFIDESYESLVMDALHNSSALTFFIADSERTVTNYLFTLYTGDFTEQFTALLSGE